MRLTIFRLWRKRFYFDGSGRGVQRRRDFGYLARYRGQRFSLHHTRCWIYRTCTIAMWRYVLTVPRRNYRQCPAAAYLRMDNLCLSWNIIYTWSRMKSLRKGGSNFFGNTQHLVYEHWYFKWGKTVYNPSEALVETSNSLSHVEIKISSGENCLEPF